MARPSEFLVLAEVVRNLFFLKDVIPSVDTAVHDVLDVTEEVWTIMQEAFDIHLSSRSLSNSAIAVISLE